MVQTHRKSKPQEETMANRLSTRSDHAMTTTIYPIPGYPTVYLTTDGARMTIRPMMPEDKDALRL